MAVRSRRDTRSDFLERQTMTRAARADTGVAKPVVLRGAEEADLLSRLPEAARIHEILDELEQIMLSEGFLHLNSDALPNRLRCSKATLYRLAGNRFALFGLIIERWLARMRDNGWARSDAVRDDPSARLVEYLRAGPLAIESTTPAFWQDLQGFPQGYEALIAHQELRVNGLEEILTEGVRTGVFQCEHPRVISDLFLTAVHRIVESGFASSTGVSVQEAFDAWYRVLEYGLIGEVGPKPRRSPSRKQ
jgi:AcrR family transcriptional regulator